MKPKISMIGLGVRDFAASLAFYRDGLGFPVHNHQEGEDFAMFALEGTWLSIYPRDKLAEDATVAGDGAGFSGFCLAHNVGSKAEVDAVFAHAVAVGPEKQHRIGIRHRLRTVGCDCRLRGAAGDHDRAVRELVLDHVHQPGASRGLRPIRVCGEDMHDIPLRAVGHLAVIRSHESTRILT